MKFHTFFQNWTDTNECGNNDGGCNQTCGNTVGSYNCECNEGYNLNSDEHGCDGKMKIR